MNLDELVNSLPKSEFKLKQSLSDWINEWKSNEEDVNNLENFLEKWHGNVWFENESISNQFYKNLCEFKTNTIQNISSMTMNERLDCFCLFDKWDLNNIEIQNMIRKKLKADNSLVL